MATSRVKTSSILQGFPKSRSLLAGNAYFQPTSYESIATLSGTGASTTISFTSIPSTFSHLQLRVLGRSDSAAAAGTITVYPNGDTTAANYARHRLSTDGATVTATGTASGVMQLGRVSAGTAAANIMGVTILDIIDYASTSKYKTFRSLSGHDQNGSGDLWLTSGLYMSLTAINRVDLVIGGNWTTATTIGLYGIKGA